MISGLGQNSTIPNKREADLTKGIQYQGGSATRLGKLELSEQAPLSKLTAFNNDYHVL